MPDTDFGFEAVRMNPTKVSAKNLYNKKLDSAGIALWAVAFTVDVNFYELDTSVLDDLTTIYYAIEPGGESFAPQNRPMDGFSQDEIYPFIENYDGPEWARIPPNRYMGGSFPQSSGPAELLDESISPDNDGLGGEVAV